jgi:MFS family permease
MMFVVATFFSFLGPLLLGVVLDHYGPRVCSVISVALITIGSFLFSISSRNDLPLFVPGLCLIALGGPGEQSAIIHLSNLFPTWKATATAVITGSFQLSFTVFLVFHQLWKHYQYSYVDLFRGYSVLCLINIVISLLMWPDAPYAFDEEFKELEEELHHEIEQPHLGPIRLPSVFIHHEAYQKVKRNDIIPNRIVAVSKPAPSLKDASLQEQIFSPEFMYLTFFFLTNAFWVNFYIGTFDLQIADLQHLEPAEAQTYAQLFTLIITLGVIAIPLIGATMDFVGFPVTSSVTIAAGIVWSILQQIPNAWALLTSFIAYATFRTFFYTFFFAYLADTFGFKYFGVLAGVVFVLGGVISFLQYPLAELGSGSCTSVNVIAPCTGSNWHLINAVMTVMILSTIVFSYKDWQRRQAQKQIQQVVNLAMSSSKPRYMGYIDEKDDISVRNGESDTHTLIRYGSTSRQGSKANMNSFGKSSFNSCHTSSKRDSSQNAVQEMIPFNKSNMYPQQDQRALRSSLRQNLHSGNAESQFSPGSKTSSNSTLRESYGAV